MSQLNYAYEADDDEQPIQNGRQTSGSPIKISSLYSQQEITVENSSGSQYNYAGPVSPAYTNGPSGSVSNVYASPARSHHSSNGKATPLYSPNIPEPDYDLARRGSYVELVTKL